MPSSNEHINVVVTVGGARTRQAGFGVPLFAATFAGSARQYGPFTTVAGLTAAALGSAPALAWAAVLMAQQPSPRQFMIGRIDAADATPAASLDAIELPNPGSFYGINHESRVEATILAVDAWVATRRKIFVAQSNDAGVLAGTAGTVALDLQTANTNRTALVYHGVDAEYLDAAVTARGMAMELDVKEGAGSWAYKQFASVPTEDAITDAESAQILAANANWYADIASPSGVDIARAFYPAIMSGGRWIDEQITNDWLAARMEEQAVRSFVQAASGNGGGIPMDDAGIGGLRGDLESVMFSGCEYGHFAKGVRSLATGRVTPYLDAPRRSQLSTQAILDRTVTMSGEVAYRGRINRVVPVSVTAIYA